jgi:hypothetical protein
MVDIRGVCNASSHCPSLISSVLLNVEFHADAIQKRQNSTVEMPAEELVLTGSSTKPPPLTSVTFSSPSSSSRYRTT